MFRIIMIRESKGYLYKDREISWMLFNERVLQEAENKEVPLMERLKFLAIFSSNNDEFFRVRVASMRRQEKLGKKSVSDSTFPPDVVLSEIQRIAVIQQERFNRVYNHILKEMASKDIFILNENELDTTQHAGVTELFRSEILPSIFPVVLDELKQSPHLKDRAIYLAISMSHSRKDLKPKFALIEIPTPPLPRFYSLPIADGRTRIMYIDDLIRLNLDKIFYIFEYDVFEAYTIKITRDAEFILDNEENDKIRGTILDKIQKSIKQRSKGIPTRMVYDNNMPKSMLNMLIDKLHLRNISLIPGGRYHNFKDFMDFPPVGEKSDYYAPFTPVPVPELDKARTLFEVMDRKDFILHHPYQSFDYLIRMLREAAIDPEVHSIKITLYRLAKHSNVVNALINALKNGKRVTVLMELQARFDEEANIFWTNQLQEAGARVHFGKAGQKVHCKVCIIYKESDGKNQKYAHVSTGNYNGVTARMYCDHGLFTRDHRIVEDLDKLLDNLFQNPRKQKFDHLLVAPEEMPRQLMALIETEIKNKVAGKPAYIMAKMNSLMEENIVRKMYDASRAGVKIDLIIRGLCTLVPGIKGLSENIRVISIIDRLLEHARIFIFANGGDEKIYLSSADWMQRNLYRRVECAFPVYDEKIKQEIKDIVALQLKDNSKARLIDSDYDNKFVTNDSGVKVSSQAETYLYLKEKYRAGGW